MRVHLWPSYEFWYQVSLLGILLLPYAYYCFILAFGGVKKSLPGKIYLAVMLICFVVNIRHGVFLGCPNVVEKNGLPTFVYEIKPTILVLFFPAGIFLIYLFLILVRLGVISADFGRNCSGWLYRKRSCCRKAELVYESHQASGRHFRTDHPGNRSQR